MGTVYPLDAGRNLIIYESGSTLYIRTTIGEGLTRPVTLCTDFAGGLSDTVHNKTVYYCYINSGHDIVVRSITDLQELYKIESRDTSDCLNPRLVSFQDTLLLFYVIKNPINDAYCLKALFPFDPRQHIMLPEKCFDNCPDIQIIYSENYMLVYADDNISRLALYFDADIRYTVLESADAGERRIAELKQSLSSCEEKIAELKQAIADREKETGELKQALADREKETGKLKQALADCEKETGELKQALADREKETGELKQLLAGCEAQLAGRDSIIENVKVQYEELMNTALKYKEEAARWYEIAHKKDIRPIPGERLITDSW